MAQDQDHNSDSASFLELRNAAEQVMKKCVDPLSSPATGGFVANLGTYISTELLVSCVYTVSAMLFSHPVNDKTAR